MKELAASCGDNAKVVARIDGIDGKASSKLFKEFSKANKTSSLLIISAGDEGFSVFCTPCKQHVKVGLLLVDPSCAAQIQMFNLSETSVISNTISN